VLTPLCLTCADCCLLAVQFHLDHNFVTKIVTHRLHDSSRYVTVKLTYPLVLKVPLKVPCHIQSRIHVLHHYENHSQWVILTLHASALRFSMLMDSARLGYKEIPCRCIYHVEVRMWFQLCETVQLGTSPRNQSAQSETGWVGESTCFTSWDLWMSTVCLCNNSKRKLPSTLDIVKTCKKHV